VTAATKAAVSAPGASGPLSGKPRWRLADSSCGRMTPHGTRSRRLAARPRDASEERRPLGQVVQGLSVEGGGLHRRRPSQVLLVGVLQVVDVHVGIGTSLPLAETKMPSRDLA
jgi:hypothetical protein